jgi:hypothetical protein
VGLGQDAPYRGHVQAGGGFVTVAVIDVIISDGLPRWRAGDDAVDGLVRHLREDFAGIGGVQGCGGVVPVGIPHEVAHSSEVRQCACRIVGSDLIRISYV